MREPHMVEDHWLSERLGKSAYHLVGNMEKLAACSQKLSAQLGKGPLFADVKIAVENVGAVAKVQALGFQLVDTNLCFVMAHRMASKSFTQNVMLATPDMVDAIAAIAEKAFVYDRFHRDPAIPNAAAAAVKREWARNYFLGKRGEWMVVACKGTAPVGFLQLLRSQAGELVIDLIAVDAVHRGAGLAQAMIAYAVNQCRYTGPVVVGTQVSNIPSVRLYEKLGFGLMAASYVFHHHGARW